MGEWKGDGWLGFVGWVIDYLLCFMFLFMFMGMCVGVSGDGSGSAAGAKTGFLYLCWGWVGEE